MINLALLRHDHIPAIRASGGPLYQKKQANIPRPFFVEAEPEQMAVWLRETSEKRSVCPKTLYRMLCTK